jgi:hypothetical protein
MTSLLLAASTKACFYQILIGRQDQTSDKLKAIHEGFLSKIRDACVELFVPIVAASSRHFNRDYG